jgi:hypothetical protein
MTKRQVVSGARKWSKQKQTILSYWVLVWIFCFFDWTRAMGFLIDSSCSCRRHTQQQQQQQQQQQRPLRLVTTTSQPAPRPERKSIQVLHQRRPRRPEDSYSSYNNNNNNNNNSYSYSNDKDYSYYDDYDEKEEPEQESSDAETDTAYWNNDQKQNSKEQQQRGGMYKVIFDSQADIDQEWETQLDWESVLSPDENENYNDSGSSWSSDALVLLPPAAVEKPTAILHFVGGTFFGSAPKLWYRTLLEDLVKNTSSAIIVTTIPVTLFKSPLNHVQLAQQLERSFQHAYRVVLEDEYSPQLLDGVPLCGLGHSLGARLLVVLATLRSSKSQQQQQQQSSYPPYKSMVLMSFTNFRASAGIPGVRALLQQSRRNQEQKADRSRQVNVQNGQPQRQRRQTTRQTASRRRATQDMEEEYYDNDEEWDDLVEEWQTVLQQQAQKVQTALTPRPTDLEFHPTPSQLWRAISQQQEGGTRTGSSTRYNVPETLLVQFDDDGLDQSSKLAGMLHQTNSSRVQFARLRGTHLSPISVATQQDSTASTSTERRQQQQQQAGGGWFGSRATKTIWNALGGRKRQKVQEESMRDLRQSIARYITDVVTK